MRSRYRHGCPFGYFDDYKHAYTCSSMLISIDARKTMSRTDRSLDEAKREYPWRAGRNPSLAQVAAPT
jgi:hypothetical protein